MTTRILLRILAAGALLLAGGAHAQIFRAYLASDGSDGNPCTLPQPCRLLPAALAAVANEGEVWMLDSANYNTASVNVTKSVTILAVPGVVGSVVATGGPAISITTPSINVTLRNLVIVPLPGTGGTHGVSLTAAAHVIVEGGEIANLAATNGSGVFVNGIGTARITNTTFRRISNGYAVWAQNGGVATVSGSHVLDSFGGLLAYTTAAAVAKITVSDSTFSGAEEAIFAYNVSSGAATIYVTRCVVDNSSLALDSESIPGGSATIAIGSSMLTNNISPWYLGGNAAILTYLNNQILGNSVGSGSLTSTVLQ